MEATNSHVPGPYSNIVMGLMLQGAVSLGLAPKEALADADVSWATHLTEQDKSSIVAKLDALLNAE